MWTEYVSFFDTHLQHTLMLWQVRHMIEALTWVRPALQNMTFGCPRSASDVHACLMTVPNESNSMLNAMLQPYWNTYLKAQTVTPTANMTTDEEGHKNITIVRK